MPPHILDRAGEALESARHAVATAEEAVESSRVNRCRARLERTLVLGRPRPSADGPRDEMLSGVGPRPVPPMEPWVLDLLRRRLTRPPSRRATARGGSTTVTVCAGEQREASCTTTIS